MKERAAELGKNEQVLFPLYMTEISGEARKSLSLLKMSLSLKTRRKPIRV